MGHEEELPVDSMPREQLGNQHSRQGRAERTESQRRGQRALAASYQIKDRKQQDDAVLPAHEGRKAGKRSPSTRSDRVARPPSSSARRG